MTDGALAWAMAVGGGALVAALYFGGLWWTVRRVANARHPAMLMIGSFLLRTTLAAIVLVAVTGGDVTRLLAALASMLVVRTLIVRSVRRGGIGGRVFRLGNIGGAEPEGSASIDRLNDAQGRRGRMEAEPSGSAPTND